MPRVQQDGRYLSLSFVGQRKGHGLNMFPAAVVAAAGSTVARARCAHRASGAAVSGCLACSRVPPVPPGGEG
eukprot:55751-Alexandrium_andersonii.AAC.1